MWGREGYAFCSTGKGGHWGGMVYNVDLEIGRVGDRFQGARFPLRREYSGDVRT